MTDHFFVDDPRGKTIICTEKFWRTHISKSHSYLINYEGEVKETLRNPSIICRDSERGDREVYYSKIPEMLRILKVVVEFRSLKVGEVITAYLVDGIKPGEKQIWTASSH